MHAHADRAEHDLWSSYADRQLDIWRAAGVDPTIVPITDDAAAVLASVLELLGE